MAANSIKTPPLPEGFQLESSIENQVPTPPEGFKLIPPKKTPSRARSLISAPIKGVLKGGLDILQASPARPPTRFLEGLIEKGFPTQDKPIEKGLERAGKLLPLAATGGEGLLAAGVRSVAGGTLGQIAEELGAPEYVQTLAELGAFLGPKLSGKLKPNELQKSAVEFLRKKGLSDKEITPLIQSEKKLRRLGKFASKTEKTAETLQGVHEKLGQGFEHLKETAKSKKVYLPREKMTEFFDDFDRTLDKISPRFKRLLKDDIADLENSRMGFNDIVDFWQDINNTVKGQTGGKAVLNKLKEPLEKGLKDIDPELSKEFKQLNEFYSKKSKVAKILSPRQIDDLFEAGKIYGTIGAVASGNFGILKKIIGIGAARKLTSELLTNPRLQNISNQMLKAINDNKLQLAKKLFESFQNITGPLAKEPSKEKESHHRSKNR